MKKSIIVLALALLMVGSVFAETKAATIVVPGDNQTVASMTTGNTESTNVKVSLKLSPKYVFGITDDSSKFDVQIPTTKTQDLKTGEVLYKNIKVLDEIPMEADLDNLVLKTTTTSYYVSYWFSECNENLALYAKIDSPLIYQKGENETVASDKVDYIQYKATITTSGTDTISLDSGKVKTSGSAEEKLVVATTTDVLGKVQSGNMKVVLGPVGTTGSLANNIIGTYLSTITLTLKANS